VPKLSTVLLLTLLLSVVSFVGFFRNSIDHSAPKHLSTVTMCPPYTCLQTQSSIAAPNTSRLTFTLFARRCILMKSRCCMYPPLFSLRTSWRRDYRVSSFSTFGLVSASDSGGREGWLACTYFRVDCTYIRYYNLFVT
jgi:hypothetical protein